MNSAKKWKIVIMSMALVFIYGTADAQRTIDAQRYQHYARPVVPFTPNPPAAFYVRHHLNQKERLAIAVAYLESHEFLTVKKYARMTKLTKATAETELDSFVLYMNKQIVTVIKDKKKVYTIKR